MTNKVYVSSPADMIATIRDLNKEQGHGIGGLNTLLISNEGRLVGNLILPALALTQPEIAALRILEGIEQVPDVGAVIIHVHEHHPLAELILLLEDATQTFAQVIDAAGPTVIDVVFIGIDEFTSAKEDSADENPDATTWTRHPLSELPAPGTMLKAKN